MINFTVRRKHIIAGFLSLSINQANNVGYKQTTY